MDRTHLVSRSITCILNNCQIQYKLRSSQKVRGVTRLLSDCDSIMDSNSPIHKAASSLVTDRSLQNGKMSMGNCCTERPPDPVLYGGRPSGGFVNRAVKNCDGIMDSKKL